jgi:hypothetical protein
VILAAERQVSVVDSCDSNGGDLAGYEPYSSDAMINSSSISTARQSGRSAKWGAIDSMTSRG